MDLVTARSFQPALVLLIAAVAVLLVIAVLALSGVFDSLGQDDLLVGPFRWQQLDATKLV
jgi:hypothetical protein